MARHAPTRKPRWFDSETLSTMETHNYFQAVLNSSIVVASTIRQSNYLPVHSRTNFCLILTTSDPLRTPLWMQLDPVWMCHHRLCAWQFQHQPLKMFVQVCFYRNGVLILDHLALNRLPKSPEIFKRIQTFNASTFN